MSPDVPGPFLIDILIPFECLLSCFWRCPRQYLYLWKYPPGMCHRTSIQYIGFFFQALHHYTQNTLQDYNDCLSKTHTAPLNCQKPLWQKESCSLYQQHSVYVSVQSWFSKVCCLLPWRWRKTHADIFSLC